jgi:uncharacterized protein YjbI with pentapeptide repeats
MAEPFVQFTPEQLVSTYSYKKKDLRNAMIRGMPSKRTGEPPEYDFRGADLSGAKLWYGDFTRCDSTDATMHQAELYLCLASFASLSSSKTFRWNRLQGMKFPEVRFVDACDFSGMDLRRVDLSYITNRNATGLPPLNLTDAIVGGAKFGKMPAERGSITKEHLYSTASYKQGDLSGVTIVGIDLTSCDFSNQNLTGATFARCDLTNADFRDAVVTNVKFVYDDEPGTGLTVEQIKSTWNYKHGRMEGILLPDDVAKALAKQ